MPNLPKRRNCKSCKKTFKPTAFYEWWCGPECRDAVIRMAAEKGRQSVAKKKMEDLKVERKVWRERKEKLKTKSDWAKEAQIAVNRFVFWRDYGQPCIACGCQLNYGVRGGAVDASHYRSRGTASHLRYNTFNIHAGCVRCNREQSGNLVPFRKHLIEKIGIERVERLEDDNNPRRFSIEYLKRVKSLFTRRAKFYERRRKQFSEAA